jgi:DNA-binding transcriptional MerR regulator
VHAVLVAELLTVGEFSRLTHLTVKALRHYHDVGVLEPALVDPSSGYRYYAAEQVEVAHLVRRLREVRMPIAGVRQVLAAPDSATRQLAIATHLDLLRAELTQTAAAVASLRALLTSGSADGDVSFRHTEEQTCLMIVADVDQDTLTPWCATAYPQLYASAGRLGVTPAGPSGALYAAEWFQDGGPVTAFLPITAPAGGATLQDGDVRGGVVPAQRLAVALHSGPCHDLDRTYGALGRHVLGRGIGDSGPVREVYLVTAADTDAPDELRTEVCWPVTAAS